MKVCLDFDGVLHDSAHPVPGRKMGPPMDGALGGILLLIDAGHEVVIHSARVGTPAQIAHVVLWLEYWGFPEIPVLVSKPFADCYIDDKGLHFNDWASALQDIEVIARNGFGTYTLRARPAGRDAQPRADSGDRQRGARLPRTRLSGQGDG